MLADLEHDAFRRGERRLWLNATLTAVGFYARHGWRRGRRRALELYPVAIPCVRMTKTSDAAGDRPRDPGDGIGRHDIVPRMTTLVTGACGGIGGGPAPATTLDTGVRGTLEECARRPQAGRLDARELG